MDNKETTSPLDPEVLSKAAQKMREQLEIIAQAFFDGFMKGFQKAINAHIILKELPYYLEKERRRQKYLARYYRRGERMRKHGKRRN